MVFVRGYLFGGPFRIVYAGEYRVQDMDEFLNCIFHPGRQPSLGMTEFQKGLAELERPTGEAIVEKLALARRLKEEVRARTFFQDLPFTVRVDTLQAHAGATFLPVCVTFSEASLASILSGAKGDILDLVLELTGADGGVKASIIDSVQVHIGRSDPDARFLYETRLGARPGQYRLVVYASLRNHSSASQLEREVDLPDYSSRGLSMSGLLLFDKVLPKSEYRKSANGRGDLPRFLGRTHPVYLRDFVLIPSSDSRFRRSQKLTAFFEVYNPLIPEGEKSPELEVRCRFTAQDGRVLNLPQRVLDYLSDRDARGTSYGISVPLLGFQTGDYQIEFDVLDLKQGKSVSRSAKFTIY
jgi:hypothetical protein